MMKNVLEEEDTSKHDKEQLTLGKSNSKSDLVTDEYFIPSFLDKSRSTTPPYTYKKGLDNTPGSLMKDS